MIDSVRLLKASCPEKKVVVEVCTPEDALSAASVGADILVTSAPYTAAPLDVKVTISAA